MVQSPSHCPNCGAAVPRRARVCPECGADEGSGWSENAGAEHLGLPDEEFNYEEFVEREFGGGSSKPRGISWFWWVTAVFLLVAMIFFLIR